MVGQPYNPVRVFVSYSRRDSEFRDRLQVSFATFRDVLTVWTDTSISPGADWRQRIETALPECRIFVALITPDFLASQECIAETKAAIGRRAEGRVTVIPVLVKKTNWLEHFELRELANLQAAPSNGLCITDRHWGSKDDAFRVVAKEISDLARTLEPVRRPETFERAGRRATKAVEPPDRAALCNRREQMSQFWRYFRQISDTRKLWPQIYVVPCSNYDREDLVFRRICSSEHIQGSKRSVALMNKSSSRLMEEFVLELYQQCGLYKYFDPNRLSSSKLLEELAKKCSCLLVRHTIEASPFWDLRGFLQWYLEEFWAPENVGALRMKTVVLLNVQYPLESLPLRHLVRFRLNRGLGQTFKDAVSLNMGQRDSGCPCVRIAPLQPLTVDDIERWLSDQAHRDDLDVKGIAAQIWRDIEPAPDGEKRMYYAYRRLTSWREQA